MDCLELQRGQDIGGKYKQKNVLKKEKEYMVINI